jgi:hypothetical protein
MNTALVDTAAIATPKARRGGNGAAVCGVMRR